MVVWCFTWWLNPTQLRDERGSIVLLLESIRLDCRLCRRANSQREANWSEVTRIHG